MNRFFIFCIIIAAATGCSSKAATVNKPAAAAAPVYVANAVSKAAPTDIQTVGNVEPYSNVTVKAQIGGELTLVDFQEGANVNKGDRLFVIDPRPYQAQVTQAEANLARDKAQLQAAQANLGRDMAQGDYAQSQSRRYAELAQQGVAAKDAAEQANSQAAAAREAVKADQAAIQSAQANIAADEAALERAKLQLEYCTIRSPIDGRTGQLLVKQGNVIKANDVDLVTINQIHPIYVAFSVPESELPQIQAHMQSGKVAVIAYAGDADSDAETGTLAFVENTIDSATGSIRLKGLFQNPSAKLWPGEFVRVVVRLNERKDSILIPSAAVQTGQDGKFVFVVKSDMTVESRPIVGGRSVGRDVVVEKGLSAGETVVVEGQLRLTPGARVEIKSKS